MLITAVSFSIRHPRERGNPVHSFKDEHQRDDNFGSF